MSKVDGDTLPSSQVENAQGYNSRNPLLHDLDGLTLYEKKCVLINREIDAQGMGKYQWYIWGLCGFGYLLDLLWAQAFGLVLGPLQQELGFGRDESGNISTSFNAGLTAGAFVWGFLADIIGMMLLGCSMQQVLYLEIPFLLLRCLLTIVRSSLGVQLDVSYLLDIWTLPWCF
jgi:hypothetical protein